MDPESVAKAFAPSEKSQLIQSSNAEEANLAFRFWTTRVGHRPAMSGSDFPVPGVFRLVVCEYESVTEGTKTMVQM